MNESPKTRPTLTHPPTHPPQVPSYVAVILSVSLVLCCGEIVPAAIFSGPNQLRLGAHMTGLVWFLILLFFPLSWPISYLLDKWLGAEHAEPKRYSREELGALVEIHHKPKALPEAKSKRSAWSMVLKPSTSCSSLSSLTSKQRMDIDSSRHSARSSNGGATPTHGRLRVGLPPTHPPTHPPIHSFILPFLDEPSHLPIASEPPALPPPTRPPTHNTPKVQHLIRTASSSSTFYYPLTHPPFPRASRT